MTRGAPLTFYNSLGRRVEEYRHQGGTAGIFSCGPLVYAPAHLGVLRGFVCIDVMRRALHWKGVATRHVVMVTDVNRGRDGQPVMAPLNPDHARQADSHAQAFREDLATLNVLRADAYPRVSEHVADAVAFAETLQRRGCAYVTEDGLCFDTGQVPDYGAISLMDVEEQREAVRGEARPGRRNKSDFALWRRVDPDEVGWDSPWGRGLPGAHLSCSAISLRLLGPHPDVHTGGKHHRELHHVNEIAQSAAYAGDGMTWVRYWLHHDVLAFGSRPMTRGGAPRLGDLADLGVHPAAYRLFVLGGRYRSKQTYTEPAIRAAQKTLLRLATRLARLGPLPDVTGYAEAAERLGPVESVATRLLARLDEAVCADLNTPRVLAVLLEVSRNPALTDDQRRTLVAAADTVLGLGLASLCPADLGALAPASGDRAVEDLIRRREQARLAGNWERADALRAELGARGVRVADTRLPAPRQRGEIL